MKEKIDLISQPKKSFWKLSIPIIAFCLFDAIYSIVDMMWVSRINIDAFYAMGVSIPFVTFIFSLGDSIGQGTNSIMSRFIGSGDYESSYNALIHGLIACNIIWFIIAFCFLFANGILFYSDEVNSYILIFDYIVPIIMFGYLFIFNNLFSETLQVEGNSRTPTILIIGSNILNIILDPIFIFNLNFGVKGAAYATIISAFLVFIPLLYLYVSGRTKVPLSLKYFKFRSYIIIEIFKVALPNFIDNGLWLLSASFINASLLTHLGTLGPILYSVSNKMKNLLIVPVRGYSRGLMSVTGHLFGARKFDELNDMFKYVLKLSLLTSLAEVIIFFFFREYIFYLFSITGMQTEVLWVAIGGIFIMLSIPISIISSKMLDGFGKSMYSLLFTFFKVIGEIGLIYILNVVFNNGISILIAIVVTEIIFAFVYYVFLIYLLRNFDEHYDGKSTVKTFTQEDIHEIKLSEKVSGTKHYTLKKIALVIALILIISVILACSYITISLKNNTILPAATVILICLIIGSYLLRKSDKLKIHIFQIVIITAVLIFLIETTDYLTTTLFIVFGILLWYIKIVLNKLTKKE